MTARDGVDSAAVISKIEKAGVQTRRLFAGNIIKHPCFDSIRGTDAYRVVGDLSDTDRIMTDSFWIGVYPGLDEDALAYMVETVKEAVAS